MFSYFKLLVISQLAHQHSTYKWRWEEVAVQEVTVHASRSSSGVFANKPGSSHWIDEDVSGSNPMPYSDDEIQPSENYFYYL